jgi:hypothetical protein
LHGFFLEASTAMRTTRPSPLISLSAIKNIAAPAAFSGANQFLDIENASPETIELVQLLRSSDAVRERAQALLERARRGQSSYFKIDDMAMPLLAQQVTEVTQQRFPTLRIPYHSRWRQFEAGGVDRKTQLDKALRGMHTVDRARVSIDLSIVSIVLGANTPSSHWGYLEASSGKRFSGADGMAVASFHAFMAGTFSSNPQQPMRVDAAGLVQLSSEQLARALQVSGDNPLADLEARTKLLQRLGHALAAQPDTFGQHGRPGGLFEHLAYQVTEVQAEVILGTLLHCLTPIWQSGNAEDGVALGDCWPCDAITSAGYEDHWMPFHKLSQWMVYSLIEPFAWAGVQVRGLEQLTALPDEYLSGLFVDAGVLQLKNPELAKAPLDISHPMTVEWRALAIALMDELAVTLHQLLGRNEQELPLVMLLEGGPWVAGHELAQTLRGGAPALQIQSDGTFY